MSLAGTGNEILCTDSYNVNNRSNSFKNTVNNCNDISVSVKPACICDSSEPSSQSYVPVQCNFNSTCNLTQMSAPNLLNNFNIQCFNPTCNTSRTSVPSLLHNPNVPCMNESDSLAKTFKRDTCVVSAKPSVVSSSETQQNESDNERESASVKLGDTFTVFHQNIRFAANKKEALEAVLEEVNPEVICLSELALLDTEVTHYGINNYQFVSAYCRSGNRGGGVGLFISELLVNNCKLVDITNLCREHVLEAAAALITLSHCRFIILCIYRPPSDSKVDVDLFIGLLTDVLEYVAGITDCVVVVGDLNICTLTDSYKRSELRECMSSFNLRSCVSTPTRITYHKASAIDCVFSNLSESQCSAGTYNTQLSDHEATFLTYYYKNKHNPQISYVFDMSKESITAFKYFLKENSWTHVLSCTDAQAGYTLFHNNLLTIFKLCFKVLKRTGNRKLSRSFYSNGHLHRLKTEIINLTEIIKQSDDPLLSRQLQSRKVEYNTLLQTCKRNHYDEIISGSENRVKSAWKVVNQETRRSMLARRDVQVRNNEGAIAGPTETCRLLQDHFLSVPRRVMSDLDRYRNPLSRSTGMDVVSGESIFMHPVNECEIDQHIRSIKNKKSSGYDNISNNLLKTIAPYIVRPLEHLINLALEQGVFPEELKIAKVTPVFKKGGFECVENYRPVSVLTSISKIFELVILSRLANFFANKNLLSTNQFGFLRGRCTIDAVMAFVEKVVNEQEFNRVPLATFLDLSAAFDCVDRGLLLRKLNIYGVRGICNKLLESYLNNRKQFVNVTSNGGVSSSDVKTVEYGVPQGSILGPFLFLVYVNGLISDNYMYADDTTCLVSGVSIQEAEISMFEKINILAQELAAHNLKVNSTKTAVVCFSFRAVGQFGQPAVLLGEELIRNEECVGFLGMRVDKALKWTSHVDFIANKISSGLFVLRNICKICTHQTASSVYYALVHSHISYGIALWGSCSKQQLDRIFKLQKRAIRYLCNLPSRESCREKYKQLDILTVPALYIYEVILLVRKRPEKFISVGDRHSYNTRRGVELEVPRHRTVRYERTPTYNSIKFYNKLPLDIRAIESFNLFKKSLKAFLVDKCIYALDDFM